MTTMDAKHCSGCKHWTDDQPHWEATESGFKRCAGVRERWVVTDEITTSFDDTEKWHAAKVQAIRAARAYVEDGSEYVAILWTGPDFFCALFEPADQRVESTSPEAS